MGRPCTHGSLDEEQGHHEGLMVQTPRVKMRRPYASQIGTMRAPWASQKGTTHTSDEHHASTRPHSHAHLAPTRLMWAMELVQMEGEIYFGI